MDAVFQRTLTNLAFENEFLMNGILGIASLHLQRMLPDATSARQQTELYRVKSFKTFREVLPTINVNTTSYEAALLMAVMLVILTSKDYAGGGELAVVRWLVLYRGLGTVMTMSDFQRVLSSNVADVFVRELTFLETPPVIPTILIEMVATIEALDPEYESLKIYCDALDTLAPVFTCLRENGVGPAFWTRTVSWPSYLNSEFVALAQASRPRAMVILTWYLAFLKLVRNVWWIDGLPNSEIDVISKMVGPKWHRFMGVPLLVRKTEEVDEIVALLLQ